MKNYFECNLPSTVPSYIHPSKRISYKQTIDEVYARTDKLNEALKILQDSGISTPETFSVWAADFFKTKQSLFENADAYDLADRFARDYEGVDAEPRIEWPNTQVLYDTSFVTTREWEDLRHFGIGGSDAAVIQGLSPYTSEKMLFHDKVGTPMPGKTVNENQSIFERGHIMEPRVIEHFCYLTGAHRIRETRMFRSIQYPHCTGNIDAIVQFPNGDLYVFEAKTCNPTARDHWKDDNVPQNYVVQTRQYPAILNDERIKGTHIACLVTYDLQAGNHFAGCELRPNDFFARYIPRDPDAEREILEANEEFWANYIEVCMEPDTIGITDYTGTNTDLTLVRNMIGDIDPNLPAIETDVGSYATVIEQYMKLNEERLNIERKARQLKKAMDQATIDLVKVLGQSPSAHMKIDAISYYDVGYDFRRGSKSCDYEMLQVAFPEAYKACVTNKPDSKSFRIEKRYYPKKQ